MSSRCYVGKRRAHGVAQPRSSPDGPLAREGDVARRRNGPPQQRRGRSVAREGAGARRKRRRAFETHEHQETPYTPRITGDASSSPES